jgi:hypothetical protein
MTLVYYCEVEQENKDSGMLKGTYPENPDLWIHVFFFCFPWCDVKESPSLPTTTAFHPPAVSICTFVLVKQ